MGRELLLELRRPLPAAAGVPAAPLFFSCRARACALFFFSAALTLRRRHRRGAQHPARDEHDTFFIKSPAATLNIPQDYMDRVKATHENGGASLGDEQARRVALGRPGTVAGGVRRPSVQ